MPYRSPIVRIVALALLVYALASLLTVRRELAGAEETVAAMTRQRELLETERAELEDAMARRDSPEELERLARERLGMVAPGERIYCFIPDMG